MSKKQILKLKGKTVVFIDWANVYNWRKSLKNEVDPQELFDFLKRYKKIKTKNFYFGKDKHPKSQKFLKRIEKIGYKLYTKDVKYIHIEKTDIFQRKCDFDIEICMSVYDYLDKDFDSFVFLSGDGDFAPVYEYLIGKNKQVIVIYTSGHLGKEVLVIKKGIYRTEINKLLDI